MKGPKWSLIASSVLQGQKNPICRELQAISEQPGGDVWVRMLRDADKAATPRESPTAFRALGGERMYPITFFLHYYRKADTVSEAGRLTAMRRGQEETYSLEK